MPPSQYAPDLARLNKNSAAMRQGMLGQISGAGAPPDFEKSTGVEPSLANTLEVARAAEATTALPPRAPAPEEGGPPDEGLQTELYGAPGDPWVYEVAGDGTMRIGQAGSDQLMDVAPGTVVHQAIQDQLKNGVLQPGQGAAASAGAPEGAPEGSAPPEPAPVAPDPVMGAVPQAPVPGAAQGLDMAPAAGGNYSPWRHGASPPPGQVPPDTARITAEPPQPGVRGATPSFDAAPLRDPGGTGVPDFLHQATSGGPQALEARAMLKNLIRETLAEKQLGRE